MAIIQSFIQPPRLYRYRSLREFDREIEAIEDGYLYCAAYRTLNDPMEGLFSSSQNLRESDDYRAVREAIRDNKAQIGMCSFSEVRNHELMWAHYADQFKGICISYNLSTLLKALPGNVNFVRMFYNETVPTIHRSKKDPSHLAKMVLSYKNYRWLYEREWRMFAPLGKASYLGAACVSRVYLGARMTNSDRNRIMDRLKRLNIRTLGMTIDKYSMSFEPKSSTSSKKR
jgi:hypothetical protein